LHIGEALGTTKNCGQCDKQNVQQIVPRVVRPRVGQLPKDSFEFPHLTPPFDWESSSESDLRAEATENSFSGSPPRFACRGTNRCKYRIRQHFLAWPDRKWKAKCQMRFPCFQGEVSALPSSPEQVAQIVAALVVLDVVPA